MNKNLRTLTSLSLVLSLLLMGASGLMLWIVPEGRVAYWNEWHLFGLDKSQWGALHIISSWIFLLAAPIHLYFNWRPLLKHLRTKVQQVRRLRWELAPVALLGLLTLASATWELPPLIWFVDVSGAIKELWSEDGANEPPFGHAEELPLRTLADRMDVELSAAVAAMEGAGIRVSDPAHTLEDIAAANGITPAQAYAPLQPLVPELEVPDEPLTDAKVTELLEGTGIGQKTLSQLCTDLGQSEAACQERLRATGLSDDLSQKVRPAADAAELTPIEVVQRMVVDR